MRILISGGPGSGCTSTASAVGEFFGITTFDSDAYFHKPTEPPFQEQFSPEERRELLGAALASKPAWILSGSIATWGLDRLRPTHGVLLQIPREERLRRLEHRQSAQFGSRIDPGGDLQEEHRLFLAWAADYESRSGRGRNLHTDRNFLKRNCPHFVTLTSIESLPSTVDRVIAFVQSTTKQNQRMQAAGVPPPPEP